MCEKIEIYAFNNCTSIKNIKLNKNLSSINKTSFANCKNLKGLREKNNFISYKSILLRYKGDSYKDKTVIIPKGIKLLSNELFMDCKEIESVIIPSSLNIISNKAFSSCENLKNVIIMGSLKKVYALSFDKCSSLKLLIMKEGKSDINNLEKITKLGIQEF